MDTRTDSTNDRLRDRYYLSLAIQADARRARARAFQHAFAHIPVLLRAAGRALARIAGALSTQAKRVRPHTPSLG